ncbi:MAG: hypothetical protein ACRYG2_29755, partial [Janthinobacterium lividum]
TGLYLEGSGSGDAGRRIWKPAMESYLKDVSPESFPSPPADLVHGNASDSSTQHPYGQNQRPGGR